MPAKMTVLKSGILITHVAMMTPWEDFPLDLWDSRESSYYTDVIGGLCHFPPTVLNPWLKRDVPPRPRQVEGVIIAHGYISVPPECHDETLVTVSLLLMDERRNELSFEFGVRVDRSVMRKCERRQRERLAFARSTKGSGLFEPKGGQPGERYSRVERRRDSDGNPVQEPPQRQAYRKVLKTIAAHRRLKLREGKIGHLAFGVVKFDFGYRSEVP